MDSINSELIQYIIDYVEKPSKAFGNLAVCPFSKKPRQQGLFDFQVLDFSLDPIDDRVVKFIDDFDSQSHFQCLLVTHPNKQLSIKSLNDFGDKVQNLIRPRGLLLWTGHPENDFKLGGEFTRRSPYPGFIVIRESLFLDSRNKLSKSYFANWSPEELQQEGLVN
jgi:hypothetical protein